MAALGADRRTTIRANAGTRERCGYVGAGKIIFLGAAIAVNATGFIVPAADAAGLKVIGLAQQHVDNSLGGDGAIECLYLTGVSVEMVNDTTSPVLQAQIGRRVFVLDDQTVTRTSTNSIVSGVAEVIEPNGMVTVNLDSTLT